MKIIGKINSKLFDENKNILLQIHIDDYTSKRRLDDINKEKEYQFEIKEIKSKRSIEQNKKLWAIIRDLSKEMEDDEMNIYCHLLEDTNAKYVWLKGLKETKEDLLRAYRAVKITRYDEEELAIFKCYEGSSKFTINEMYQLIEKAIEWANELGINTDYLDKVYGNTKNR